MAREDIVNPRAGITRIVLSAYGIAIFVFLFAPVVMLVLLSFNESRTVGLPMRGLTLSWYRMIPGDSLIQDALAKSLKVGALVTLASATIGTAAAFPLVRARLRYRSATRILITLPIMIPGLLIGVSLLVLFTDVLGWELSMWTAVLGQTVLTTPFVILIVSARLEGFNRQLELAAADLGANLPRRLWHIVLPLVYPGIVAAALLAFTLSLDEFIVTNFLIGADQTLPIYIYTQIKFGITPEVNALATLMLVATLVLIGLGLGLPSLLRLAGRLRRASPDRPA